MSKTKGLIAAYLLDGKGGGTELTWKDINQWDPNQGLLWLHLNYTSKTAINWIKNKSQLDKLTISTLIAEETRPRSLIFPNSVLVCLRGVNFNPGEDPEDMVSIRIWIDQNKIITTRCRRLLSVDDLRQGIALGQGPTTPTEFLVMLNDRLTNRMSDVIDGIDDDADSLEGKIINEKSHLLRPQIAEIRRQSISIRRYLAPQREALNRLYSERHSPLSDQEKLCIRETADRVIRYIEDLDAIRERASITQEELSSRLSEQMEKRMYILSVVAVIFIPLSFITGLLGINVKGIPGEEFPWAFEMVCTFLFVIFLVMIFVFKKKKWI